MMLTNDMVNLTLESCTIVGSNYGQVFVGNGAFINNGEIVGIPGVSGTLNLVTSFTQTDRKDNSSCFDFEATCGPTNVVLDGRTPMFMETQNADRPDGDWLNVQIGNWKEGSSFTIALSDFFGKPVNLANITSHMGNITESGTAGTFVIDVHEGLDSVQLLHISMWADYTVDFFKSLITVN